MKERQNSTDHARTAHPRAGEWFKNSRDVLGLGLLAVGVVALAACLFAAAYGQTGWTTWLAIGAALAGVAGALWLLIEGRRVRRVEARHGERGDLP